MNRFNFKYLTVLAMLLLSCTFAMAQTVSGTITSSEDNEPLPGVNVVVKGTTIGTATDIDGKFQIKASSTDVLVLSAMGFMTEEVTVGSQTNIKFSLSPDMVALEDVVVIGYGTQKKSDVTGAIASVSGEALKNRSATNAATALQGKAAGVQILNSSGKPDAGADIRVRGYSSNGGNISPLLIVDGLQVTSIQYLDPDMIESMEVLKDAASAAIYGAQAGNGVILITTKSGSKGEGTINYTGKFTRQSLGKVPNSMNAKQWKEWVYMTGRGSEFEAQVAAAAEVGLDLESYDTNWIDEVMEETWSKQHTLSVTGGNKQGNYFASLSHLNNNGIVVGNKDIYERLTAQMNADYKIKEWLQVGTNTSIEKYRTSSVGEGTYGGTFEMALKLDPMTPVFWDSPEQFIPTMKTAWDQTQNSDTVNYQFYGENGKYYATSYFNQRIPGASPFIRIARTFGKNSGVNVNGVGFVNITPIKSLVFTSRFGYRLSFNNSSDWNEPYYVSGNALQNTYSISASSNNSIYYQWENFANFNKTFADVHSVSAMAGMSFIQNNSNGTNASASGKDIMKSYDLNYRYVSQVKSEDGVTKNIGNQPGYSRSLAYFGRLGYSYNNKYNVQFNLRADAFDSSKLAKDARWGIFPSVSGGWTLTNEDFVRDMVDPSILSFAKLRASWGVNGNVSVLNNYPYAASINTNGKIYQANADNSLVYGSMPNGIPNPDLKWETSHQIDLGLDMRFMADRLSVGIDYYKKTTKDLLVNVPCLPAESGQTNLTINTGEVLNTGIELELTWKDKIGDFNYSVTGNMASLKNEVKAIAKDVDRQKGFGGASGSNMCLMQTQFEVGQPIWYMYGYKYAGKDEDDNALYINKDGEKVISGDLNEGDKTNVGQGIPKLTYGLTLNMEYKGFDFAVFGTGVTGNNVYYALYQENLNNSASYFAENASGTKQDGTYKKGSLPNAQTFYSDQNFWSSSANVFSGAFFKIKQIQLGYTLPKELTQKAMIQNLRCFVSLDDYFTFTKYIGLDPETTTNGGNATGIDQGAYPTMRKLVLGVNLTF